MTTAYYPCVSTANASSSPSCSKVGRIYATCGERHSSAARIANKKSSSTNENIIPAPFNLIDDLSASCEIPRSVLTGDMWVSWFGLLAAPLALVLGTILAGLAAATTALALGVLTLRLAIIYLEMILTIVHAWLIALSTRSAGPIPGTQASSPSSITTARRYSRSSSIGSNASAGRPQKSDSFTRLGASFSLRDFESVGGWRIYDDEDEEDPWASSVQRSDLSTRRRPFSFTLGGSQLSSALASPELGRTPARARTPGRGLLPGSMSPEGYFSLPLNGGFSSGLAALTTAEKKMRTELWH